MGNKAAKSINIQLVIKDAEEPDAERPDLWSRVCQELNTAVEIATDVSKTLSTTTQSVHEQTLLDISSRLQTVLEELEFLDEWLECDFWSLIGNRLAKKEKQCWITRRNMLQEPLVKLREPVIWAALTTYSITQGHVTPQSDPADIRNREAERFTAKNKLNEFVKALRLAIKRMP